VATTLDVASFNIDPNVIVRLAILEILSVAARHYRKLGNHRTLYTHATRHRVVQMQNALRETEQELVDVLRSTLEIHTQDAGKKK
jgi:hypothetical protein